MLRIEGGLSGKTNETSLFDVNLAYCLSKFRKLSTSVNALSKQEDSVPGRKSTYLPKGKIVCFCPAARRASRRTALKLKSNKTLQSPSLAPPVPPHRQSMFISTNRMTKSEIMTASTPEMISHLSSRTSSALDPVTPLFHKTRSFIDQSPKSSFDTRILSVNSLDTSLDDLLPYVYKRHDRSSTLTKDDESPTNTSIVYSSANSEAETPVAVTPIPSDEISEVQPSINLPPNSSESNKRHESITGHYRQNDDVLELPAEKLLILESRPSCLKKQVQMNDEDKNKLLKEYSEKDVRYSGVKLRSPHSNMLSTTGNRPISIDGDGKNTEVKEMGYYIRFII
uniref:Uncharacterized protein n=1 Tax=Heterorhabditis bacteriophora TaxID=37862 RepID=A0A1I7WYH3_HETBA